MLKGTCNKKTEPLCLQNKGGNMASIDDIRAVIKWVKEQYPVRPLVPTRPLLDPHRNKTNKKKLKQNLPI